MNKIERQAEKERLLTVARVREMLHYDPETGMFRWRASRRGIKAGAIAGRFSGAGYWQICIDRMYFYAHRLAWLYVKGVWPRHQVDHRDLNKTNNRFLNLREAERVENQGNKPTARHNASRVKGVRWNKIARKWQARITDGGKDRHLGYFEDRADAAAAYAAAAKNKFGQFARTK